VASAAAGEARPYLGPVAKRVDVSRASDAAFATLAPGQTMLCREADDGFVHIGRFFALKPRAHYRVSFVASVSYVVGTDVNANMNALRNGAGAVQVATGLLVSAQPVVIRGSDAVMTDGQRFGRTAHSHSSSAAPGDGPTYVGCSSSQQKIVVNAHSIASHNDTNGKPGQLPTVLTYFAGGDSCDTTPFATWFGSKSIESRWDTMFTRYENIKTSFGKAYKADCTFDECSEGVYAFVYPTDRTHTIHLCDVFWEITKDQPGTLVHEMSHFTDVVGTQDYAYGQDACKKLAKSNQNQAMMNADNFEFMGEDYPQC